MLMSRWITYLIEPGNIGRGGAICIDRDPIVNQVYDLKRGAYSGSSCAWLEAIAMLGLDIQGDLRWSRMHTIGFLSRCLSVRWSKLRKPVHISDIAVCRFYMTNPLKPFLRIRWPILLKPQWSVDLRHMFGFSIVPMVHFWTHSSGIDLVVHQYDTPEIEHHDIPGSLPISKETRLVFFNIDLATPACSTIRER